MKSAATVTSKGQITLPKPVREALGLREGDVIEFASHGGKVEVRNAKRPGWSAGLLHGRLPKGWKAPTVEQMNEGVARAMADRAQRSEP